jgi:hypothetical protein
MPSGDRTSPPPLDGPIALLRELHALEQQGETSDMRFGPLSGYLTLSALTGALRAPGLSGSVAEAGERMRAEIRRAVGAIGLRGPDLPAVYARLDELSEDAGPRVDEPGEEFTELVSVLQNGEQQGVRLDVHAGPLTLFLTISLLQLALRHPSVAQYLAQAGDGQTPVELIARGLTQNFGGYARELLEQGFDPAFDVDADGVPIRRYGWSESDGTMIPVGLGPDMIFDVVPVAQAACPGCGENPLMALSELQAMCGNDDCNVFMWNPQETAEEFWASAREQVLIREAGSQTVRHCDVDAVPEGAQIVGFGKGGLMVAAEDDVSAVSVPTGEYRDVDGQRVPVYETLTVEVLDDAVAQAGGRSAAAGQFVEQQRDGEQGRDAEDH